MAVRSFTFINLVAVSLCSLAVPPKVIVPIGRSTHVTCAYTENNAADVCLSWNRPPTDRVHYIEVYNITGRFLTMEIQASQKSEETLTCTARNMNTGTVVHGPASTALFSCPHEELFCDLEKDEASYACLFKLRCRFTSECFTALRCEVNGAVQPFPGGLEETGDWYTVEYCHIGLTNGDTVLCYLYAPYLSTDLQTKVVIHVPSSTTAWPTVAPTTTTASPGDVTPTMTTTELPSDNCPQSPCTCYYWLFTIALVPIGVAVVVLYKRNKK